MRRPSQQPDKRRASVEPPARHPVGSPFAYEDLDVLGVEELAWLEAIIFITKDKMVARVAEVHGISVGALENYLQGRGTAWRRLKPLKETPSKHVLQKPTPC